MSLHTRGMLIGAEGDRLIVQANPEDVARYTRLRRVQVAQDDLAKDGWELVPIRPPDFVSFVADGYPYAENGRAYLATGRPTEVRALLRTACGCERDMMVPFPLKREIKIPMYGGLKSSFLMTAVESMHVPVISSRTFELEVMAQHDGKRWAVYKERMTS